MGVAGGLVLTPAARHHDSLLVLRNPQAPWCVMGGSTTGGSNPPNPHPLILSSLVGDFGCRLVGQGGAAQEQLKAM